MKRLALIAAAILSGLGLLLVGPAAQSGRAGDSSEVEALFHNAANVVAGEDVKVAGVPAGVVESVDLNDENLAVVTMTVDAPFAPFRADARCEVRPQSLIGERFVQCDPGTPEAGPLAAGTDGTPTVPVSQTSAPIDLDLVFDTLRGPYRERLAIILNELGAGLAGRGEDLNAIIRSANPALQNTRDLLRILNDQRDQIKGAIDDTDRVLASVAEHPHAVGRFIRGSASVSERFGRQSTALGESIRRLPGLLAQTEPALRELDGLSVEGLPVLRNLRRSAPAANRLAGQLGPLARAARPTLHDLGGTAVVGRRTLERSGPFADALRRTMAELHPLTPTTRALLSSLVERGGTEGLLRFFYNSALATSRFDGTSHIFPAHLVAGACGFYRAKDEPVKGCEGRFGNPSIPPGSELTNPLPDLGGIDAPIPDEGARPGGQNPPKVPSIPSLPPLPKPLPVQPPSSPIAPKTVDPLLDFLLGQ